MSGAVHHGAQFDGPAEQATTIKASFEGATVSSRVKCTEIETMLDKADAFVREHKVTRPEAKTFIIMSFQENKHLEHGTGNHVVLLLLWLACRGNESGKIATRVATEGGNTIEYQIARKDWSNEFNFRLLLPNKEAAAAPQNTSNPPQKANGAKPANTHCHFEHALDVCVGTYEEYFENKLEPLPNLFDITKAREGTANFVFTERPPDAIEEFGFDLIKADLFSLPFESCYFQWPDDGIHALFAQNWPNGKIACWSVGNGQCIDGERGWGASPPFSFALSDIKTRLESRGQIADVIFHVGIKPGYSVEPGAGQTSTRNLIACVALLSSKGIEREAVVPREAVNRKRIAAGKTPLPSYTIIRFSRYPKSASKGGTHASPVPHFRRGHVRTLGDDRKTIVRPTFVMAEPGTMPTYIVKP